MKEDVRNIVLLGVTVLTILALTSIAGDMGIGMLKLAILEDGLSYAARVLIGVMGVVLIAFFGYITITLILILVGMALKVMSPPTLSKYKLWWAARKARIFSASKKIIALL